MTFKCHKIELNNSQKAGNNYGNNNNNNQKQVIMYPVNAIGFNPRYDKFLYTAGADGNMFYWDHEQKNKIRSFHFNSVPVTCCSIDPTGYYMAYALGYDWHEGVQGLKKQIPPRILVHAIPDQELAYQKR